MLYAIVSDIHANATALKNVLTDAHDLGAERIICLGDVLGYGPQPAEALELVYRNIHVCLAGNHDDAVCGRADPSDFTEFAEKMVLHHRKLLTDEAIAWLKQLPYVYEEGLFACTHGDFSAPEDFNYILETEDAIPSWMSNEKPLMFTGHTHECAVFILDETGTAYKTAATDFKLEPGRRYIVNPGSAGYPRTGACRSSYCLFDDETLAVSFRQLPFDLEGYRLLMEGRGLDEAPWMLAKENASRRPSLRTPASFAKPSPAVINKTGSRKYWLFISIGIIAAALTAATLLLFRPKPPVTKKPPAENTAVITQAIIPAPSSPVVKEKQWLTLIDDWKYSFENPTDDSVSLSEKEQMLVFHSNSPTTVVLTKEIKVSGNGKIKLQLKPKKGTFSLEGKIFFLDDKSCVMTTIQWSAAKGKSGRNPAIPDGAVSAKTEISIKFNGDLILTPIVFEAN